MFWRAAALVIAGWADGYRNTPLKAVSGLGAALGRVLLAKMRLSTLRRVGGLVCLIMATLSVLQLLGVIGG